MRFVFTGFGQHLLGSVLGESHQPIFVADNDVPRVDHHPANGHRHVDLARPRLVRAAVHHGPGVAGGVLKARHITNGAIDDKANATPLQGVQLDQLADDRVIGITLPINHQYVAGLQHHQSLVDVEVVAWTGLDRQRGTHELACTVVARQATGTNMASHVVADMRGNDRGKCFDQGIRSRRGRGCDADAWK